METPTAPEVRKDRVVLPIEYREYRPKLNGMFEALACPARRRVLEALARGISRPSEIAAAVGVSPPTVIYHIRKLQQVGLVERHFFEGGSYVDSSAIAAITHYLRDNMIR